MEARTFPGLIGRKLGMAQIFMKDGSVIPVTTIEAGPCTVVQVKTAENDGYQAVQLGFGEKRRLKEPEKGHLKGLGKFRYLREFRWEAGQEVKPGQQFQVDLFQPGDRVDVTGVSKGKGFAGGVKRHHFAGGPKTHGQSDRHRAPGSVGSTTTPGRVYKGKRMAGHMGAERVTVQGLEVVQADKDKNLLLVRGAVPGARGGLLLIQKGQP